MWRYWQAERRAAPASAPGNPWARSVLSWVSRQSCCRMQITSWAEISLVCTEAIRRACQEAGRAAKAIPLHQQALANRERVLGPDPPSTLTLRNNLANAYQATGRAS